MIQRDPGKEKISKILYLNLLTEFKDKNSFIEVYKLLYEYLPEKIKNLQPIIIKSKNRRENYGEFKIKSFLKKKVQRNNISQLGSLLENLDLDKLKKLMKIENLELIGIDESKVEVPLEGSIFTYLKSTAFRMFKDEKGYKAELIGPLVQEIKLDYVYTEKSEKEIQFLEYLRNLYIMLVTIKNSLHHGRRPLVFIHGPLIRAIGGFTDLFFEYDKLNEILSINIEGQEGIDTSILTEIKGKKILEDLYDFEKEYIWNEENWENLRKNLLSSDNKYRRTYWRKACPWELKEDLSITGEKNLEQKLYSGFIVYLYLLKLVYDICKENNVVVISVVEDISKATEFSKYLLPNLFFDKSNEFREILSEEYKRFIENKFGLSLPRQNNIPDFNDQVFKYAYNLSKKILISDNIIFTSILSEAEYTTPIPTFRYQTREFFERNFGHTEYGIDNDFKDILNSIFPYPEYKILATYLRTTPFREPIRIEFFDAYDYSDISHEDIIGITYFLSLFYHQYGLPVILKYVDALARTPKTLVERIVKAEVERILREGDFDMEAILRIFNQLSRNFFRR